MKDASDFGTDVRIALRHKPVMEPQIPHAESCHTREQDPQSNHAPAEYLDLQMARKPLSSQVYPHRVAVQAAGVG